MLATLELRSSFWLDWTPHHNWVAKDAAKKFSLSLPIPPSSYLPSWSCVSDSLLSESNSSLNVRQRYPFFFRIWQMRKPTRPMTKKTKTSRISIYKPCWWSTSPSVVLLCSDIRSYKRDGKTQSSLRFTFVVPAAPIIVMETAAITTTIHHSINIS